MAVGMSVSMAEFGFLSPIYLNGCKKREQRNKTHLLIRRSIKELVSVKPITLLSW